MTFRHSRPWWRSNADVVGLEAEPEDVTELIQFHDETLMNEDWLQWMSKEWFFDLEPNSGKDAVKIVEMQQSI